MDDRLVQPIIKTIYADDGNYFSSTRRGSQKQATAISHFCSSTGIVVKPSKSFIHSTETGALITLTTYEGNGEYGLGQPHTTTLKELAEHDYWRHLGNIQNSKGCTTIKNVKMHDGSVQINIREKVKHNIASLLTRKISITAANTALHTVIIPQIMYPATYNNMTHTEINHLQVITRKIFRKKLNGSARNLHNNIVHGHKDLGGMNIDKLEDLINAHRLKLLEKFLKSNGMTRHIALGAIHRLQKYAKTGLNPMQQKIMDYTTTPKNMWLYLLKQWMENNDVELRQYEHRLTNSNVCKTASGNTLSRAPGDIAIIDHVHYQHDKPSIWKWMTQNNIMMLTDLVRPDGTVRELPETISGIASLKDCIETYKKDLGAHYNRRRILNNTMIVKLITPTQRMTTTRQHRGWTIPLTWSQGWIDRTSAMMIRSCAKSLYNAFHLEIYGKITRICDKHAEVKMVTKTKRGHKLTSTVKRWPVNSISEMIYNRKNKSHLQIKEEVRYTYVRQQRNPKKTVADITNLIMGQFPERSERWFNTHKTDTKYTIVGCSDGSVYDHKVAGGFAWNLYERMPSNELRDTGITGVGKEEHTSMEIHSIHSYRAEALGLLAACTFLRQHEYRGKIEWHTDCQGVITSFGKIKWKTFSNWYAQRDKDVWERLELEYNHWKDRLQLIHVKAHSDKKKGAVMTPEQQRNNEMDIMAKRACLSSIPLVANVNMELGWQVWMNEERITGHTKTYTTEQIKFERIKQHTITKPQWWGAPAAISFTHMIATAPHKSKSSHRHEAQFMWGELPTNDKIHSWGLQHTDTCECCGRCTETMEHLMYHCTQQNICKIRKIMQQNIMTAMSQNGATERLERLIRDLYQLKNDGTVVVINEHTTPEQWSTTFHQCPENGHTMRSKKIAGLAAEIVYAMGDTRPLWTGVIPHALVQIMRTEQMQEHQIRKAVQQIRTHLHTGKRGIWRIRNLLNFDPKIEQERVNHRSEKMRVRLHLAKNDKARATGLSVQTIMNMTHTTRTQWMRATTDRRGRQIHIDTIFQVIENTRDTQTRSERQNITAQDVIQACATRRHAATRQRNITAYMTRTPGVQTQATSGSRNASTAQPSTNTARSRTRKNIKIRPLWGYTKKRARARAPALAKKSFRKGMRPVADKCDVYNPVCEACDKRASTTHSLKSCYSCNLSWHKGCHPQLRNGRRAPAYWQCEECKAQEPHTPQITTHMAQAAAGAGSGTGTAQGTQASTAHAEWVNDTRADHATPNGTDDEDYEEPQDDIREQRMHRRGGNRPVKRKKRSRTILDTDSETEGDTDKPQHTQHARNVQKRYEASKKKKRKK